jgi:hypothetical protein
MEDLVLCLHMKSKDKFWNRRAGSTNEEIMGSEETATWYEVLKEATKP